MVMSEEQIRSLIISFGERWNARDSAGLSLLFTPDADLVNAFGIAASGRESIDKFHTALFASMFKAGHFTGEPSRFRAIRADIAVLDLRWSVTGMRIRESNPNGEMNGLMAMVVAGEAGEPLIATMHVMQFPAGSPSVQIPAV